LIVALDNTFLTLILNENSKPRPDPLTGEPVRHWRARVEGMIDAHSDNGDTIIIPTPCLAEALTVVPSIAKAIDLVNASSSFQIAPFDAKCAIELGLATHAAIKFGDKKGGVQAGWAEVKFDRQIAIIAKTAGARRLYTDDANQAAFAEKLGLTVCHTWQLEISPKRAQVSFLEDE
jgi:hypothetical protein